MLTCPVDSLKVKDILTPEVDESLGDISMSTFADRIALDLERVAAAARWKGDALTQILRERFANWHCTSPQAHSTCMYPNTYYVLVLAGTNLHGARAHASTVSCLYMLAVAQQIHTQNNIHANSMRITCVTINIMHF